MEIRIKVRVRVRVVHSFPCRCVPIDPSHSAGIHSAVLVGDKVAFFTIPDRLGKDWYCHGGSFVVVTATEFRITSGVGGREVI